METVRSKGKIVVVGAGFVGASAAFSIAMSGIASELVLVDVNKDKALGEAMDLNHGLTFMGQMKITDGEYSDCKGADIIVITAGTARKPGETRLDLSKRNASIIKSMVPQIMEHYTGGILVVVSNPVDVLTYMVQKLSGLPKNKVVGSGTVLDSSRFRYLLAQQCGVDVRNVHANIIGEHGDSEVPLWSSANIAGVNVMEYNPNIDKDQILKETVTAGAEVIKRKGATYYGIALSVTRICEAILKDQESVLTVGNVMDGEYYGIEGVALSLPSIVGRDGIKKVLDIKMTDEELAALKRSASKIKEIVDEIEM